MRWNSGIHIGVVAVTVLLCKAAAQTAGTFSVLSYNIAGLPGGSSCPYHTNSPLIFRPEPLSSSKPKTNTPLISPQINHFDIVHVQEG